MKTFPRALSTPRTRSLAVVGLIGAVILGTAGCGDDDGGGGTEGEAGNGSAGHAGTGSGHAGRGGSSASGAGGDDSVADAGGGDGQTLCAKYGGADAIGSVMKVQVFGAIGGDCRINPFFSALSNAATVRVGDCLAIQAQELFGCPGIHYAGSTASNGLPCRSMVEAHAGMGLSQGDFDALIEDVVAGLTEAGVEEADIEAAAPALLGLQDQIVEKASESDPTMNSCDADGGA